MDKIKHTRRWGRGHYISPHIHANIMMKLELMSETCKYTTDVFMLFLNKNLRIKVRNSIKNNIFLKNPEILSRFCSFYMKDDEIRRWRYLQCSLVISHWFHLNSESISSPWSHCYWTSDCLRIKLSIIIS